MGFIIRSDDYGVTKVISALKLKPELYHTMLHFFRSTGYEVPQIYKKWIKIVQKEVNFMRIANRVILLGDHIKIPKEGRRMPGIQIIHQESQNSGKGEYIEGHIHAQVSALISGKGLTRSLPLWTERQQSPPKLEGCKKPNGDTLITQMLNLAAKAAGPIDQKIVLALDAYFAKASAFLAADKCVLENGERQLEIITRGRRDTVGYTLPNPRPRGKRGPNRKYGERIALYSLFSDMGRFTETTLQLYGKPTKVRFQCMDLIWKPLGRVVRFVAVESCLGKMVLMYSGIDLQPEDIITTFALRFKIETSFNEQKNGNGCFAYRFWTTALPKRKRWSKNNRIPVIDSSVLVEDAEFAIDSYICLSTISVGIMTVIGFTHNSQIWGRYPGWVRTRRFIIPTIAIIKETLAHDLPAFLQLYPALPLCSIINNRLRHAMFLYDDIA